MLLQIPRLTLDRQIEAFFNILLRSNMETSPTSIYKLLVDIFQKS